MRTRQQSRVLPGQDCSSSFRPHQHWQDRAQGRQCVSQMARSGAGGQRVGPLLQAADPRVQAPRSRIGRAHVNVYAADIQRCRQRHRTGAAGADGDPSIRARRNPAIAGLWCCVARKAAGPDGDPLWCCGAPISGHTAPQPRSQVVSGRFPCRQRHWPQGSPQSYH